MSRTNSGLGRAAGWFVRLAVVSLVLLLPFSLPMPSLLGVRPVLRVEPCPALAGSALLHDSAGRLPPVSRGRIEAAISRLEEETGVILNVVIEPEGPPGDFRAHVRSLFEETQASAGRGDRAVLLYVAEAERRARIEAGAEMAEVLPETKRSTILRAAFGTASSAGGLADAVEFVVSDLLGLAYAIYRPDLVEAVGPSGGLTGAPIDSAGKYPEAESQEATEDLSPGSPGARSGVVDGILTALAFLFGAFGVCFSAAGTG